MYPLLSSVEIRGFRGLRGLSLEGLGRVNLFVGGSNSGKTSILEVLAILGAPLDPLTWLQAANRREPSPLAAMSSSKVDRLKYLFPLQRDETLGDVEIAVSGECEVRGVRARALELGGMRPVRGLLEEGDEDDPGPATGEVERAGLEVELRVSTIQPELFPELPSNTFQVWEQEPLVRRERPGPRFEVRALTPYEHWLRMPAVQAFSKLGIEGRMAEVVDLLRELDPNIVEAAVFATQKEPALYLRDSRSGFLPLSSYGDGMRRAIALALAVPRARDGLLLVDEIETGLHYSILGKMYAWLVGACVKNHIQLFVTTHSLEAVDALLAVDTFEEQETTAYRLGDGGVRRLGETQLRRMRSERGLDIR